ncbi:MAG: diguanylate cyclase [Polyangiaceae bacterium]
MNTDPSHQRSPLAIMATRIVEASLREDASVQQLARLAASDPGFGVRVLSVVNSAAYGMPRNVTDVGQAASLLGARGLRNIGLSLALSDMVPTGRDGDDLLALCLRRAVAARLIADALGDPNADEHFTVGLFLEVGMLAHARKDLARAADLARRPAAHRPILERADGLEPHDVLGASIASEFHLPTTTIAAIAHHHDAACPKEGSSRVAWLAERFAGAFEGADVASSRAEAERAGSECGLAEETVASILQQLPEQVVLAAQAFNRDVGPQPDLDTLAANAQRSLFELNLHYERVVRQLEQLVAEKEELAAELAEANERLKDLAATDALTELPNRRAFNDALIRDLARAERERTALSLIMVDVDHFKRVNDLCGHQAGDLVLSTIAGVIKRLVRTGDVVARFGGEEFVVLLPRTEADGAGVVAERLRRGVEAEELCTERGDLKVTASFGVATLMRPTRKDGARLVSLADEALYAAKDAGRNRVKLNVPDEDNTRTLAATA